MNLHDHPDLAAPPADPRAFWSLEAGHPLDEEGWPQDLLLGHFRIAYRLISDGERVYPDFEIHGPPPADPASDPTGDCYAHAHDGDLAFFIAVAFHALAFLGQDGLRALLSRAGVMADIRRLNEAALAEQEDPR